jgi:hypothetical protein
MIIIDDIMSEIELGTSRVRRTSEMSCFNFTNLMSSMINHTMCYIRWDNIPNEWNTKLFIYLTNLFQSKIVTTKVNKIITFLFFIIAVIAMQLRTLCVFIGSFMIRWYMNYIVVIQIKPFIKPNLKSFLYKK